MTAVAIGIGIITAIFTPWGVVIGSVLAFICLAGWFWPRGEPVPDSSREAGPPVREAA